MSWWAPYNPSAPVTLSVPIWSKVIISSPDLQAYFTSAQLKSCILQILLQYLNKVTNNHINTNGVLEF